MKFATLKIKKIQVIALVCCALFMTYNTAIDTTEVAPAADPHNEIKAAIHSGRKIPSNVKKFYASINYRPLWVIFNGLSKAAHNAIRLLDNAHLEGLDPTKYRDAIERLSQLLGEQKQNNIAIMKNPNWIRAELLMTKRMLEYTEHLNSGMMRPRNVHPIFKFPNPRIDAITILAEAAEDNCVTLTEVAPKHIQYKRLKNHLAWLIAKKKKVGDLPKITAKAMRQGSKQKQVVNLRKILVTLGYLNKSHKSGEMLDSNVDKALKDFQKAHTLKPDGVAGSNTKDRLNMTWHDRITMVLANMERWRWVQQSIKGKHIYVNVALYEVRAMRGKKEEIVSPAIVGQKTRRTPIFNTHATDVIVNPSWGIPNGIFLKDKLHKLRSDPGYASSRGYSVFDHYGNRLDPYSIDWHSVGPGNIPVRLRQRPGRSNALGQVKINLSMNKYLVYMHDTPTKNLFSKTTRTFSSGCVRLKKPKEISAWVMDKNTSTRRAWGSKDIQGLISKGSTRSIMMKKAIPVHFIYSTIWVEKNGRVKYSDDPYKLDKIHINKLRKSIAHLDYSKISKEDMLSSNELGPCEVPPQEVAYAGAPVGIAGGNAPQHYVAPQQTFNYGAHNLKRQAEQRQQGTYSAEPDDDQLAGAQPQRNYSPQEEEIADHNESGYYQNANRHYNSDGQDLRAMHQYQPDPEFGP